MEIAKFRALLKEGRIAGAYLFAGEEDYLKKYYMNELRRAAEGDEAFALFNRASFDGDGVEISAVAEAICSPPMMADYKFVEWKYPEIDRMRESERAAFAELGRLTKEHPETVFAVFCAPESFDCGSVRRPSKLAKELDRDFCVLNFEKSTDAQLLSWLKKHFDAEGIEAGAQALSFLLFRVGHSMTVLSSEVEKLSAYLKANGVTVLTEEAIATVSAATEEYDGFALSNAITEKNREKAFGALHDMEMRKVDPGAALAMLSRSFADILTVASLLAEGMDAAAVESFLHWNPYKVKVTIAAARRFGAAASAEALADLRAADAASKSGGSAGYTPLEIFLAKYL